MLASLYPKRIRLRPILTEGHLKSLAQVVEVNDTKFVSRQSNSDSIRAEGACPANHWQSAQRAHSQILTSSTNRVVFSPSEDRRNILDPTLFLVLSSWLRRCLGLERPVATRLRPEEE